VDVKILYKVLNIVFVDPTVRGTEKNAKKVNVISLIVLQPSLAHTD
jgi:hypothetical protein